MANPISPDLSILFENENIQDKEILETTCVDTIKFELPYAYITDRKLKKAIDTFKITVSDGNSICTPIFLYMVESNNRYYEWWLISPYLALNEKFYKERSIGFYKAGSIYIIIDYSVKRNVKIIRKEIASFCFITNIPHEIFNIEPILELDIRTNNVMHPTLRITDAEIDWLKKYKVSILSE